jgi:hypothetical protein
LAGLRIGAWSKRTSGTIHRRARRRGNLWLRVVTSDLLGRKVTLVPQALRAFRGTLVRRVTLVPQALRAMQVRPVRLGRKAILAPLVRRVILVRLALKACKVTSVPLVLRVLRATSVPQVLRVRREKLVLRVLRGWCGVAHGVLNRRTRSAMW